jgi:penicillin-binding protein 1A
LVHSRNIVSVKLLQQIGFSPVFKLAGNMGIYSPLNRELPLALGASAVSLLEMTGAYTVFANKGIFNVPACITKVQGRNRKTTPWDTPSARQVLTGKTSALMTTVLGEVIEKGTGKKARGIKNGAGKTGTTDDNMDAWFIGYSDQVTTGVWLGYDKGQSLGRGETGGQAAAPVWKEFMEKIGR